MGVEEFATFDDVPVGRTDPPNSSTLAREQVDRFVAAIEETNPLFSDEEAAKESEWGGVIAPCTASQLYGRRDGSRKSPQAGGIHAKHYYEFHHPARVGDTLTNKTTIVDKYIKRERKYVVQVTVTTNQDGQVVCIARLTAIMPA